MANVLTLLGLSAAGSLAAQVWGASALFLGAALLYGAILTLPTTRGVQDYLKSATETPATI